MTETFLLPNYGVVQNRLPEELYSSLLKECLNLKNKKTTTSGLTAMGVPKHYDLSDKNFNSLKSFLNNMLIEYNNSNPHYIENINILNSNSPFVLGKPWINCQKKYEYLPLHEHDGVLAYNIWIKIPVESIFEFNYNSIIGKNLTHRLKLNEEDQGRVIIFPSNLQHVVYPFYNSNKTRISIAGNVLLQGR